VRSSPVRGGSSRGTSGAVTTRPYVLGESGNDVDVQNTTTTFTITINP
jgi:hypothetical protein